MSNPPTTTSPPADDARVTWDLLHELTEVFERHGFRRGDAMHAGRALAVLPEVAQVYSGERDNLSVLEYR